MVKLIFHYYKDLVLINVVISICLGLLTFVGFKFYGFPISYMTGGYILSVGYYEMSKQKQYYFYFNKGLSKIHLYLSSFIINSMIGILLILIIRICEIC
jgi:hypothetical protein